MNKITLAGEVITGPIFSHAIFGEKFYIFFMESLRGSNKPDILPCIVPEIYLKKIALKETVKILGEIRTINKHEEDKRKVEVFVFVKEVVPYEGYDENAVEINGFICKTPNYRKTPLGKQITDFVATSNRRYGRTDYVPSIAWGRNAVKVSEFLVGTEFNAKGRLQSREYTKRYPDGSSEKKIAYELSMSEIEEVADADNS